MTALESPQQRLHITTEEPQTRAPVMRRLAIAASLIAVVVVAGVTGWFIGDDKADITAGIPVSVLQVHDGVVTALMNEDSGALIRWLNDGATWVDPHGTWTAPVGLQNHLDSGFQWVDLQEIELENAVYLSVYGHQLLATEWTARGLSGDPDLGDKKPFATQITTMFEFESGLIAAGYTHFNQAALYNW